MSQNNIVKIELYYRPTCSYCTRVIQTLDSLNITAKRLNTAANTNHRNDLIAQRKKATVPVLRIYYKDGREKWMPESRDIIQFLKSSGL